MFGKPTGISWMGVWPLLLGIFAVFAAVAFSEEGEPAPTPPPTYQCKRAFELSSTAFISNKSHECTAITNARKPSLDEDRIALGRARESACRAAKEMAQKLCANSQECIGCEKECTLEAYPKRLKCSTKSCAASRTEGECQYSGLSRIITKDQVCVAVQAKFPVSCMEDAFYELIP